MVETRCWNVSDGCSEMMMAGGSFMVILVCFLVMEGKGGAIESAIETETMEDGLIAPGGIATITEEGEDQREDNVIRVGNVSFIAKRGFYNEIIYTFRDVVYR